MKLLSHSRLKSARKCKRLHRYEYQLGYRPVETAEVLRFGTLIDHGLAAWWREPNREARLDAALAAVAGEANPFDRVRAEVLLTGYHFRWVEEPYEALAVRAKFEMPLINPATGAASRTWRLRGEIDLVVRHIPTGRVLFIEHKTTSEDIVPGSVYYRRLRMDSQVSVYFDGAKALDFNVEGCLYDVLGKFGQRPLKATPPELRKYTKPTKAEPVPRLYANQREADETPEEFRARLMEAVAEAPHDFFQRADVVRLDSELDEARFDVWQLGRELHEAELADRAPRNPDACAQPGRICPFFAVCSGEASLEDPALFTRRNQTKEESAHATDNATATAEAQ